MKRIAMLMLVVSMIYGLTDWPQVAHYEYHSIDVEYAVLDWYWGLACGYDKLTSTGLAGQFDFGNYFVRWDNVPANLSDGYVYNDIISGFHPEDGLYAYVVGYKQNEPSVYKGIVFRCEYEESGWNPPSNFVDLTQNLPDPYKHTVSSSCTPILSVAVDEPSAVSLYSTVAISGGNGMILFSTDHGQTWFEPATRPYDNDESEWYKCTFYNYMGGSLPMFVVIGDNEGIIAWTTDLGNTWTTQSFPQTYSITDYGTHAGTLLPLGLPNATFADKTVALIYGYFAIKGDGSYGLINASPENTDKNWWWWQATCYRPDTPNSYWFGGSDGGIIRYVEGWEKARWIRYPCIEPAPDDTTYMLTGMGYGYYGFPTAETHFYAVGDSGQCIYWEDYPLGNITDPWSPDSPAIPGVCEDFTMVYDPVFEGFRMFWSPPDNHKASKVGGYWVCPPEDDGEIGFIANKSPIPRTTYFLAWPLGSYLNAGACAMRRDGLCGNWFDFDWFCAIDRLVGENATGMNNARRLLYGNSTTWFLWSKGDEVYVAYSADSGKNWIYREAPAALGSGNWPAAALDSDSNPAVCWVENVDDGWQVTARIHYRNYDGSEWSGSHIIKEEVFTGAGYLHPSVSVSYDDRLHIVYNKVDYDAQLWQLWYGEFALDDPESVEWYVLDNQSVALIDLGKLRPTIGTDSDGQPMVIWNRPNASTFYFAWRDGEGEWQYKTLGFTGTNPCIEVKGTTANVVYENNDDIWYCAGGIAGFGKAKRISNTRVISSAPVIANNVIVWQEHYQGDYEIWYSYLGANGKWTTPAKLFGYPYLPDLNPQIAWAHPFAFVGWTQGDAHKIVAFNRKEIQISGGGGPQSSSEIATIFLTLDCTPAIFNKATEISYSLSHEAAIELLVYNTIGQLVAVVDRGIRSGYQCLMWVPEDMQGQRLSSGIYFLQLKTDDTFEAKKMVIVE